MTDIQNMFKTWGEAWSTNDPEKMFGLFSETFIYEDVPSGHQCRTLDELKAFFERTFSFSPDFKIILKGGFLNGDFACFEWTMTGSNPGEQAKNGDHSDQPTLEKTYPTRGITIWELDGGKVKRNSDYYDLCSLFGQAGLIKASQLAQLGLTPVSGEGNN